VTDVLLLVALLAVAVLFASVGHAGGSGYLGLLALGGFAPAVARPSVLILNIVVAVLATWRFGRVPGLFRWRLFWPFALGSLPASWLGGAMPLHDGPFRLAVGLVLLFAAARMLWHAPREETPVESSPPLGLALLAGSGIGLLSGWIGVGGGIFLSPLLIGLGWASTRQASALAAPFILVNSAGGLAGLGAGVAAASPQLWVWIPAVVVGGWLGATYGSRRGGSRTLRKLLAVVLAIAGLKLLLT
jgi:hypothetical protein